jgi:RNA polymerase sigma-70 factor (ECF subfamily)
MKVHSIDKTQFEKMIKDYSPMLYAQIRSIVLNHDDTDDALQETFLKAWKSLSNFRGESEVKTWLSRIAINEALMHLRKNQFRKFIRLDKIPAVFHQKAGFDQGGTEEKKLENAMKILSNQQRTIFGMRYYTETPFKEIADIMDIAEGTVKATYHQAFKKIENHLRAHSDE